MARWRLTSHARLPPPPPFVSILLVVWLLTMLVFCCWPLTSSQIMLQSGLYYIDHIPGMFLSFFAWPLTAPFWAALKTHHWRTVVVHVAVTIQSMGVTPPCNGNGYMPMKLPQDEKIGGVALLCVCISCVVLLTSWSSKVEPPNL